MQQPHPVVSRRKFLSVAGASAAALALGTVPAAARPAKTTDLVNPYTGSVPLVFPLTSGSYDPQLVDNWHASREGQPYTWSHRSTKTRRAHDGIDIFPASTSALPTVFAPFSGIVAAVAANGILSTSTSHAPRWTYSPADIYGNFVWIKSTSTGSEGYFFFACHLQDESVLNGLQPDQLVTSDTPIGALGDTGNAAGSPQLHVELHYPGQNAFACKHCRPRQSLTAINPFRALQQAQLRP